MLCVDGCLQNLKMREICAWKLHKQGDLENAGRNLAELARLLANSNQYGEAIEMYEKAADLFRQMRRPDHRARMLLRAAELAQMMGRHLSCANSFGNAAWSLSQMGARKEARQAWRYAACEYANKKLYWKAGDLFREAANCVDQSLDPDEDKEVQIQNLVDAVVAFAHAKEQKWAEHTYNTVKSFLGAPEKQEQHRSHFHKMIEACESVDLDALASRIFVDKMDRKLGASRSCSERTVMRIWKFCSLYGEDWKRALYTFFAPLLAFWLLFYFPASLSEWGFAWGGNASNSPSLLMRLFQDFFTSFELSANVFTTLGLINVSPNHWIARLAVSAEVLLGVFATANLATVVFRKFCR